MNRRSLIGILLGVSLFVNVLFIVFAYIQKTDADSARQLAISSEVRAAKLELEIKTQLDVCESLRVQCEESRESCERKILALSNKKTR